MATSYKIPKLSGTLSNDQWIDGQDAAMDICKRRNVRMQVICSSAKTRVIVKVRDEIITMLHDWGWSTTQIGARLSKDHSMVVRALQRIEKAGLTRPPVVQSGGDEIGRREVLEGALCDDENTERQGGGLVSDESTASRSRDGGLGSSSEQRGPHGDSEGCRPSETQLCGSTGDGSGENSCGGKRRRQHRQERRSD